MATEADNNLNLDSTKTASRPSAGATESQNKADGEHDGHTHLNEEAMGSAKRAQNRIHSDEESTPGNTIFSK